MGDLAGTLEEFSRITIYQSCQGKQQISTKHQRNPFSESLFACNLVMETQGRINTKEHRRGGEPGLRRQAEREESEGELGRKDEGGGGRGDREEEHLDIPRPSIHMRCH